MVRFRRREDYPKAAKADPAAAIRLAGDRLGYFHIGESNRGYLGDGVIDFAAYKALLDEIDRVAAQGLRVTPDTLRIAENTPLILPLHPALDRAREAARGAGAIGTTGRGIGPAYEDKVARRGIRIADLHYPKQLEELLRTALEGEN